MSFNARNQLWTANDEMTHDYRPLQDDKTVLENPHKGWYYHFIDNGYTRPFYRDGFAPDGKRPDFPGLNHLYLRFDWSDIEIQDGVFDWSYLDEIFRVWGEQGYRFSLRLCTYETTNPYATPKWLVDQSICGQYNTVHTIMGDEKTVFEPDYGDPLYLDRLERMMQAYGEKFNGHPLVEYIDVGTFGTWGEGHTSSGSNRRYGLEVLKRHIDLHLKYFPNTFVLVNDDMIGHLAETDPESAAILFEDCLRHRMGLRDDSIYVAGLCKINGYDTMRHPTWFRPFAENAPVDLEKTHHSFHFQSELFQDGYPFLEALRTAHATYAGFHGYIAPWLELARPFTEYCANRLGYWYFIDGLKLGTVRTGETADAVLYVRNRGFARAYYRYDLRLMLRDANGRLYRLNAESPDNTRWDAESAVEVPLRLDFTAVPPGKYTLCIGLYEGPTAIRLAIRSEQKNPDGSYHLESFSVDP